MKTNFKFTLPEYSNNSFEFESNIFSGKSTLKQNGAFVEQSKEKGKPFLIKTENDEIVKAFPKASFPDFSAPVLKINDKKYKMTESLKWYEYVFGGLPIVLIFGGGLIGGAAGGVATVINYTIFREEAPVANKYLKVLGVNILCCLLYFFAIGFIYNLIH